MRKIVISVVCAGLFSSLNAFDLGSVINEGSKILTKQESGSNLSEDYKTSGLKKALDIGTKYAINSLSGKGFLNNSLVKIPLPKSLQSVASIVSKVGGQKYVDDLVQTMNLAAGEAVPKTASIFGDAISSMSIEDATSILNGKDNATTEFFRTKTSTQLNATIAPIVKKAISSNKVIASYQTLLGAYNQSGVKIPGSELLGQAKGVASALGVNTEALPMSNEDLDAYVTRKTIDGMFYMIGTEEKKIRSNPLGYSSELIQKVFSK